MLRPLATASLLLSLLLTGCGEQPQALDRVDGVTVLVAGNRSGGSDQRIAGTLRNINGCLGLELNEQNKWIAVFPNGSEVADDGLSVTLPNGSAVSAGDFIEAGGDTFDRGHPPENAPDIPAKCGNVSAALLTDPHVSEEDRD